MLVTSMKFPFKPTFKNHDQELSAQKPISSRRSWVGCWSSMGAALLLVGGIGTIPQPAYGGTIHRPGDRNCTPVGRVILSWDRGISPGAVVCAQDKIVVGQGLRADLLCPTQRKVVQLKGGEHFVSQLCRAGASLMFQRCTQGAPDYCARMRSVTSTATAPSMLMPLSDSIPSTLTHLEWSPVNRATDYRVYLVGEGINWNQTLPSTQLDLTQAIGPLVPGGSYQVMIIAQQNGAAMGQSSMVLNVLTMEQQAYLTQAIQQIQGFSLSENERVQLIDSLYLSEQLLSSSIQFLHQSAKQSPKNPWIYLMLGDRYQEAGLPGYAEPHYETAQRLAQQFQMQGMVDDATQRLAELHRM